VLLDISKATLQAPLSQLKQAFNIKVHGNFNGYLGIKIDRDNNGNIHMSQPHLINSILVDLKLLDENRNGLKNTHTKNIPSMFT
jgi:hypothetical protein